MGKQLKVIIDRIEGDYYVGRSEFDSPEVDPEILIERKGMPELQIGEFYVARIIQADDYDLYGEIVSY